MEQTLQYCFYCGKLHADGALNGSYGVERFNTMLVDIHTLASGVVGSALSDHIGANIFIIQGMNDNFIRTLCHSSNEYDGAVGIYYPQESYGHQRVLYHGIEEYDDVQYNKVLHQVLQYTNSRSIDTLYTWDGLYAEVLQQELGEQRRKTEEVLQKVRSQAQETYSQDIEELTYMLVEETNKLQKELHEKDQVIQTLKQENKDCKNKMMENGAILVHGEIEDFYPGESREIVLDILRKAYQEQPDNANRTRRCDVLEDILEHNPSTDVLEKRKEEVKRLLKNFNGLSPVEKKQLKKLGFEITEEGKHYKLKYYGDDRYEICFAKTPSDVRSGKNNASTIIKKVF